MGRSCSFSNVKIVAAFIRSRGYAATAASQSSLRNGAPSMMLKKGSEESSKISWIPDPVTGYYRPENHAKEIDAADLRETLINNKK